MDGSAKQRMIAVARSERAASIEQRLCDLEMADRIPMRGVL